MMKAVQLTQADTGVPPVLSIINTTIPTPTPEHLLVKVHASAIQPSDLLNSRGGFPYTTFPRTPGRDFAGTIAFGPRSGEEVYGTSGFTHAFTIDGFHAEFCLVREDAIAPKPSNISFLQAACIGVPFTTAALTLRRAAVKSSDTVVVIGARGSVGFAVVQLARKRGCLVITVGRDDKADICTARDPELKALSTLTQGRGIDVVIDTVGVPSLIQAAIGKLAYAGRMAFIAAPGDSKLVIDLKSFYRQEKSLVGCNSLSYSVQEMAKEMAAMTTEFEKGTLVPPDEKKWTKVGLDQAAEAYAKAGHEGAGKYVIVME